jgi:hypothetical protein
MLELLSLLLPTLARLFRNPPDLVIENLLLRHQLQIALRSHPRSDLRTSDRFFWLVVRRLYPGWKRHLILIQPETGSDGSAEAPGCKHRRLCHATAR